MKHIARSESLFAIVTIPLAIQQWTPVPIGSQSLPVVTVTASEWRIETNGNAGGFAYLLEAPILASPTPPSASWDWRVSVFPKTSPKIPFDKNSDDYALRVGALISDSDDGIQLPSKLEKLLDDKQERLLYVVFYCSVPSVPNGPRCAISPYNDHFVNCLVQAAPQYQHVTVSPIEDAVTYFRLPEIEKKRLKLIGLWAFADSDNSHSTSKAGLREIQVVQEPGTARK